MSDALSDEEPESFFHTLRKLINHIIENDDAPFDKLEKMSKNGLKFQNGSKNTGNYADIIHKIFHDIPYNNPIINKNYFTKFTKCHEIIIKHNPDLINNKVFVCLLISGCYISSVEFLMYVLFCSYEIEGKAYSSWFDRTKIKSIHDDYFDVAYDLFMIYVKYCDCSQFYNKARSCISHKICSKNKYQNAVIKILLNDFGVSKYYDNNYGKINNEKCGYFYRDCEVEIKCLLKNIFDDSHFDIVKTIIKYDWFKKAISTNNIVPPNDKKFIELLNNVKIRKLFASYHSIIFELVRRRRTKVIRYIWKHEKKTILKLKNVKGQNILEYAKSCRGLMHKIIRILSN